MIWIKRHFNRKKLNKNNDLVRFEDKEKESESENTSSTGYLNINKTIKEIVQ